MSSKSIGGGTKKKNILSNIQIGVGGGALHQDQPKKETPPAKGSKITLFFPGKLPSGPDARMNSKDLLNPVLDFSKQSLLRTGIEALPPEFQEAVKNKEALDRDGSEHRTACDGPAQSRGTSEKNAEGVEQEDWIYNGRGRRVTFVTFEKDVVVKVTQY